MTEFKGRSPSTRNADELLLEIKKRSQDRIRFVIALSGFGGSGKTTMSKKLADGLENTEIIHLDDFIVDRLSARSRTWEGFDWDRLICEVLKPVSEGADVLEYGVYDWSKNTTHEQKKVTLKKYLIVEGVGLIREDLRRYFDLMIWIDMPIELASARGRKRDRDEPHAPGHDVLWDAVWIPNDQDYFESLQPASQADFLLRI